jgi:membrane-bound lytic murein transglycosylase
MNSIKCPKCPKCPKSPTGAKKKKQFKLKKLKSKPKRSRSTNNNNNNNNNMSKFISNKASQLNQEKQMNMFYNNQMSRNGTSKKHNLNMFVPQLKPKPNKKSLKDVLLQHRGTPFKGNNLMNFGPSKPLKLDNSFFQRELRRPSRMNSNYQREPISKMLYRHPGTPFKENNLMNFGPSKLNLNNAFIARERGRVTSPSKSKCSMKPLVEKKSINIDALRNYIEQNPQAINKLITSKKRLGR